MLKMNTFKLPKNKQFNYTPRYYQGKEVENIYDFDSAIKRDRETFSYDNFRGHWREARGLSRNRKNSTINLTVLIIGLLLLLFFMYIIDFDLSIFKIN